MLPCRIGAVPGGKRKGIYIHIGRISGGAQRTCCDGRDGGGWVDVSESYRAESKNVSQKVLVSNPVISFVGTSGKERLWK